MIKKALSAFPALITGGLGLCPACIPFYVGILGVLGISITSYNIYVTWLIPVIVAINLTILFWKAPQRHGYAPFALGVLSAALIFVGKIILAHNIVFYLGIFLLILSSIWNIWPKHKKCTNCPSLKKSEIK